MKVASSCSTRLRQLPTKRKNRQFSDLLITYALVYEMNEVLVFFHGMEVLNISVLVYFIE
ncbi:F-box/kelch-repeat protein [Pyrus ussuriensis x Pyrus communis]|uniref:F-box/kelch-repeat protein n=1 Tax=Pyrus ussuriensis x Pyrus communis TaxID=2448454 RepID=A0A5N5I994_9ROSA|nr:F-box/kelch-repeat protein [Pyrus ussuriensis x Pyrus communis]